MVFAEKIICKSTEILQSLFRVDFCFFKNPTVKETEVAASGEGPGNGVEKFHVAWVPSNWLTLT